MKFYDTTNPSDSLYHRAYKLLNIGDERALDVFPLSEFTDYANRAYEDINIMIQMMDGSWQHDDQNYTDLPISYADLVANQQRYTLNKFSGLADNQYHQAIDSISVADQDGYFRQMKTVSLFDKLGQKPWLEIFENANEANHLSTGDPTHVMVHANVFDLYPVPDTSRTSAIRIHFRRSVSYFVVTDTTKEPGFERDFHAYIAEHAALQRCIPHVSDQYDRLLRLVTEHRVKIRSWYEKRLGSRKNRMKAKVGFHK